MELVSKYVTIRSFGKARNVSMEMRVDDSCDLSLELSAVNGTIKYYDGEVIKVESILTDQSWSCNSHNHWESDAAEFLPTVGTINISSFVKIVWNRLKNP